MTVIYQSQNHIFPIQIKVRFNMSEEALIIIDVQNDFCPNGALAVRDGDQVIPPINAMIEQFDHVILTQDWHPSGHTSFASQHHGKNPFEITEMPYGAQTLWPDHCVQGTNGANFHKDLNWMKAELVIRKGFRKSVDSYSAFFENDKSTPTGLGGYLNEQGIKSVIIAGLATDFCVAYSAIDAATVGLDASVILPACRAIDMQGSLDVALSAMKTAGVVLTESTP